MRIEKGKHVHCMENSTGERHTGILLIAEDSLRLKLFSYDDFFHIQTDHPVHLMVETGECASLHDCIEGGSGTRGGPDNAVRTQDIIANAVVIGPDPWTEGDRIRRVSFSVEHTMGLMRNRERMDGIAREKFPHEHLMIFTDRTK